MAQYSSLTSAHVEQFAGAMAERRIREKVINCTCIRSRRPILFERLAPENGEAISLLFSVLWLSGARVSSLTYEAEKHFESE